VNPRKTILAVAVILTAIAVLVPAGAFAAQKHAYSAAASFGEAGAGAGQLNLVAPDLTASPPVAGSGLAVNDETGDVYVADTGNHRISEFSSSGAFVRAWGWGVENGTAEAQVCTAICQAGVSGSSPGEFESPTFVAVDNSGGLSEGDVYVADSGDDLVSKFGPAGNLISTWGNNGPLETPNGQLNGANAKPVTESTGTLEGPFGEIVGIAVDSTGNLWVLAGGGNGIRFEYGQTGTFLEPLRRFAPESPLPAGLGLDAEGNFYFVGNGELVPFKTVHTGRKGRKVSESSVDAHGLALDPATADLYINHAGTEIEAFPSSCESFLCVPTQTFGAGRLIEAAGLAVASDGTVYAADAGTDRIAVFPVSLETTVSAATEVRATTATVNGTVDPKTGGNATRCFFRVGPTTSYGQNVPCLNGSGDPVGTELSPIEARTEVHADLTGLEGGNPYHFTLRAFNLAEEVVTSEDESFETLPIPVISGTETNEVTATSATLQALVDPEGLAVTGCTIQWGTSTSYGTIVPCEPPTLPAGTSPLPVTAHLGGLTANTTYHWRVVAVNANGTAAGTDNTFVFSTEPPGSPTGSCPNEALRQANGSLALPDCRAYELIDPPQKNGALLAPLTFGIPPAISQDGSRMIASTLQCFAGAQSCTGDRVSKGPPFEFERTASGWVTHSLAPPASRFEVNSVWGYSAEAGDVLYSSPVESQLTDEFYARAPSGTMEPIGPIAEDQGPSAISGAAQIATADLSHLVYESNHKSLWSSFDATEEASLYEYVGTANPHPFLVGVTGGRGSEDLVSKCQTSVGALKGAVSSAVSADGRTVYFESEKCSTGAGANAGIKVPANQLYARIDGESSETAAEKGARTVEISARSATECSGACAVSAPAAAHFEGASESGSLAVFTSTQQLTDNASQDPSSLDSAANSGCQHTTGPNGCNLYLYEDPQQEPEPTGTHLIDVSAGDTSGIGPQVKGVMAISADGSHVYFVAGGVLSGPNSEGKSPSEGADNLYAYQHDARFPAGHVAFVATLPGRPEFDQFPEADQWKPGSGGANVTPDGRFLLFTSHGALTSDAGTGEGPAQVYRYDAESERLDRVSIGAQGFNNDGNSGTGDATIPELGSGSIGVFIGQTRRDPAMSDDGSRIFFRSPVGLAPQALDDVPLNGRGGLAQNIYEWDEDGVPGCDEIAGCVHLISDGVDVAEGSNEISQSNSSAVELFGTDEKGTDVFFSTTDPLVPADTDTGYDIYDARAEGGFAPAPAPTVCQGDTCKGQGTQAASESGAATSTFSGPPEGPNVARKPPCAKGKVRKQNKCMKKPHKKPAHHKRSTKKHKHANNSNGGKK
jgi:ribosomal protein L24E